MIIEKGLLKRWIESEGESRVFTLSSAPITVSIVDKGAKLALAATVYEGGNYIPQSVRKCLTRKRPFISSFETTLYLDEDDFRVILRYLGEALPFEGQAFQELIYEFDALVEEWRRILDEHDKNDLIHVRVK